MNLEIGTKVRQKVSGQIGVVSGPIEKIGRYAGKIQFDYIEVHFNNNRGDSTYRKWRIDGIEKVK